jgi:TRAP-type uncharacterized transport system substrate-binding protein
MKRRLATIQALPVRVVVCYVIAAPQTLIARPGVKSVNELKAKSIAVGSAGTSPFQNARLILSHFGLDPEKRM